MTPGGGPEQRPPNHDDRSRPFPNRAPKPMPSSGDMQGSAFAGIGAGRARATASTAFKRRASSQVVVLQEVPRRHPSRDGGEIGRLDYRGR